ncbi:RHS repeat-associated core domain-containing protein, partial [Prosthecobacter debontii]
KDEDPTGLLNEGFRYRDIETGMWLSRDPAGFVDGPNLYAYVKQNPWTAWDPLGLSGWGDPRGLPGCSPQLRNALDQQDRDRAVSAGQALNHLGGVIKGGLSGIGSLLKMGLNLITGGSAYKDHDAFSLVPGVDLVAHEVNGTKAALPDVTTAEGQGEALLSVALMAEGGRASFGKKSGAPLASSQKALATNETIIEYTDHTSNTFNSGETFTINRCDYSHIVDPPSVGPGKPFTQLQKEKILQHNKDSNRGVLRSDRSGALLIPSQKSQKSVTPATNEAQVDHVEPRSVGGENSSSNAMVLSRSENRQKSNNTGNQ